MADETKKPEGESQPTPKGSLEHDLFGDDESLEDELFGLGAESGESDPEAEKPTTQMPAVTPEREAQIRKEFDAADPLARTLDKRNPVTLKYTGVRARINNKPAICIFETADGVAYQLHSGEGVMEGFEKRQAKDGRHYMAQIGPEGEEIQKFPSFASSEELAAELEHLGFEQDVLSLEEIAAASAPEGEAKPPKPGYPLEPTFFGFSEELGKPVRFDLKDEETYTSTKQARFRDLPFEPNEVIEGRVQSITYTDPRQPDEKITLPRATDDQMAAYLEKKEQGQAPIPLEERKPGPQPAAPAPQTAEQQTAEQRRALEAEVAAEILVAQPAPAAEAAPQYAEPDLPPVSVPPPTEIPPASEVPPASLVPPPSQPEPAVEKIHLATTQPAKTQYQPKPAQPAEASMKPTPNKTPISQTPEPIETPAPVQPKPQAVAPAPQAPASAQPEPAPQPVPPLETIVEAAPQPVAQPKVELPSPYPTDHPSHQEPQTHYERPKETPQKPSNDGKKNGRWKKFATAATAAAAGLALVGVAATMYGKDLFNYCAKHSDVHKKSQAKVVQLEENERNTICNRLAENLTDATKFDQVLMEYICTSGGDVKGYDGPQKVCEDACYDQIRRGDKTATDVVVPLCIRSLFRSHREMMENPAPRGWGDFYFCDKKQLERGK